jgi:hypothetical protein
VPFERKSDPLLPWHLWIQRVIKAMGLAAIVAGVSLLIGVLGYHYLGNLAWIDSILEASMILGGEGPIATMSNDTVKLFASAYALFSGLVLLSTMGILLAPWLHRMMHRFHGEKKANTTRYRKHYHDGYRGLSYQNSRRSRRR